MATTPAYASTVQSPVVQISTANTNRDGTGTLGTVLTAAAAGTRVNAVTVTAAVTTTAGMVRLFIGNGSNIRLLAEIPVTAITVGASTPAFTRTLTFPHLVLQNGYTLQAATHNAEAFNVFAFGGDLT